MTFFNVISLLPSAMAGMVENQVFVNGRMGVLSSSDINFSLFIPGTSHTDLYS